MQPTNETSIKTSAAGNGSVRSCSSLGSLAHNNLTNHGKDMSGIIQLANAIKQNSSLQSLKCVPLILSCSQSHVSWLLLYISVSSQ